MLVNCSLNMQQHFEKWILVCQTILQLIIPKYTSEAFVHKILHTYNTNYFQMNIIMEQDSYQDTDLSPNKKKLLETYEKENFEIWDRDLNEKPKLKLITKTSSRISTLDGLLVEKIDIASQNINIRNDIEQEWKKVKQYEQFIVEILFQMKLLNRLQDGFQIMLDQAYETYTKRKIQGKSKHIQDQTSSNMASSQDKGLVGILKKQKSQTSQSSTDRKKVTLVSSQNSSDTGEFTKTEVPQFLHVLTQNHIFKKFCFNKWKIENIHVYFSKNFKFFTYKVQGKDNQMVQPMSQLVDVLLGRSTKNFKKYLKKGEQPEDNVSFSLVFMKRTYDLQAESPQIRTKFVNAISDLMKCSDYNK